jgi:hypothetical protein
LEKIPKILIYIEGGLVQDVYSEEGIDYRVIDYDREGCYDCPWCWEKTVDRYYNRWKGFLKKLPFIGKHIQARMYEWCSHCKINWDETGAWDIAKMWMKGELD